MSVCLSMCEQVEILPNTTTQNIPECSKMFQNVQECSRMLTVSKSKPWNNSVKQLNSICVHSLGCPRLPKVNQFTQDYPRLPKVTQGCWRLPKVACSSMRLQAFQWACMQFQEQECSSISLHTVPWACMKLACSYISLHAVPWAGMQFLSLSEQLTRILQCLFT